MYSFIAFLAFLFGTASLYFVIQLGQSIRRESDRRFHSHQLGLFSIIQQNNAGKSNYSQMRPLDIECVEYLKHGWNYIYDAAPELRIMQNVRLGNNKIKLHIVGVLDNFYSVHELEIAYGRFITNLDSAKAYCVLGHALFERLKDTPTDSLIGKNICCRNTIPANGQRS